MLKRIVALLLLAGASLMASAGAAAAHAQLSGSTPASGSVLVEAPAEIALTWDEPVTVLEEATGIRDAKGQAVTAWITTQPDSARIVPSQPLPPGGYIVRWAVSSSDGHLVRGSITFAVGSGAGDLQAAEQAAQSGVPGWVDRGLAIASRVLLVLSAAVILLPGTRLALLGLAAAAASLARIGIEVVGGAGAVALQAPSVQSMALGAAAGIAVAASAKRREFLWLGLAMLAAIPLISGHALSLPLPWLWAGMVGVHLVAAFAWVGVLAAILVAGSSVAVRGSQQATRAIAVLLPVSLIVGIRLMWGGEGIDLQDPWTRIMAVKLGLVTLMLALGLLHHRAIRSGRTNVRAGVAVELVLALAVSGLGASLMQHRPPAVGGAAAPAAHANHDGLERTAGVRFDDGSTGSLTIHGSVGSSFMVMLTSPAGSHPTKVEGGVAQKDQEPITIPMAKAAAPDGGRADTWTGTVLLPSAGQWQFTFTTQADDGGFLVQTTGTATVTL